MGTRVAANLEPAAATGAVQPQFGVGAAGVVAQVDEVEPRRFGRVVNGVGADPDIVVASAKAYLSALNKLQNKSDRVAAQG